MKNLLIASFACLSLISSASGQVKSVAAAHEPTSEPTRSANPPASRARVLGNDLKPAETNVAKQTVQTGSSGQSGQAVQLAPELKNHPEMSRVRRTGEQSQPKVDASLLVSKETPKVAPSSPPPSNLFTNYSAASLGSTQVYRIGPNDVLDIQIAGRGSRESTLFTVLSNGLIEYPLAGEPITVAGLTTAEVASALKQRIRMLENPVINVSVRDFASHAVTVTGLVAAPGRKVLRREAVPLFTVLAEALVLPEAGSVTITRPGRSPILADMKDSNHMATLVVPGDMIKVSSLPPAPTEFFFIGGAINSPGQKPFHEGLTLTQALLASGGTTVKSDARIRIYRLGQNGRLSFADHGLKKIHGGKDPDPVLQKGDRIEVMAAN